MIRKRLSIYHLRLILWFVLIRIRLGKKMVDIGYWMIRHSFDVAGVDVKYASRPRPAIQFHEWTKKYSDKIH